MANVIIYTTAVCPYCIQAKKLFDSKKVQYQEIRIDLQSELREEMINKSGIQSVPQIFIDDKHIGGFNELYALDVAGELDLLLKEE